ncbi:MAG: hypothetical protein ETSY1_38445 [Candidatus Entotheonella factor]|uniref:Uncharacterized protein n=1 Tax=Entotheonella factor TaxID=1429438 RepID=W4L7E7_ENTF1|nr:MAG: hypothetical protein ETSY1_38445 [Candidatus Entotheonella factor]
MSNSHTIGHLAPRNQPEEIESRGATAAEVDSRVAMAEWNAEQLIDLFAGKRPPRLVNPQAWETFAARFETAFGFWPDAS